MAIEWSTSGDWRYPLIEEGLATYEYNDGDGSNLRLGWSRLRLQGRSQFLSEGVDEFFIASEPNGILGHSLWENPEDTTGSVFSLTAANYDPSTSTTMSSWDFQTTYSSGHDASDFDPDFDPYSGVSVIFYLNEVSEGTILGKSGQESGDERYHLSLDSSGQVVFGLGSDTATYSNATVDEPGVYIITVEIDSPDLTEPAVWVNDGYNAPQSGDFSINRPGESGQGNYHPVINGDNSGGPTSGVDMEFLSIVWIPRGRSRIEQEHKTLMEVFEPRGVVPAKKL